MHAGRGSRRAGGGAERAAGLRARAQCARAHLRGGRGLVEQHFAGRRILVVQAPAHRRRAVGRGRGVVAARGRVLAVGVRAAAVGRRALAKGVGRLARGGGVRAFGIGAHVVALVLVVARGLEVAVVRRRLLQLLEVHRVGAFRARGHVGDLALGAGAAHRDAVVAVGLRAHAQGDAVHAAGVAARAQRGAALAFGGAQVAQRGGVGPGCPGAGANRRGVIARGLGREQAQDRASAHRHALRAQRHRRLAQGHAVVARSHAVGAQRRGVEARSRAPAAHRGAVEARRIGATAHRRGVVARGRRQRAQRRGFVARGHAFRARRRGEVAGRLRAPPEGGRAVAVGDRVRAGRDGALAAHAGVVATVVGAIGPEVAVGVFGQSGHAIHRCRDRLDLADGGRIAGGHPVGDVGDPAGRRPERARAAAVAHREHAGLGGPGAIAQRHAAGGGRCDIGVEAHRHRTFGVRLRALPGCGAAQAHCLAGTAERGRGGAGRERVGAHRGGVGLQRAGVVAQRGGVGVGGPRRVADRGGAGAACAGAVAAGDRRGPRRHGGTAGVDLLGRGSLGVRRRLVPVLALGARMRAVRERAPGYGDRGDGHHHLQQPHALALALCPGQLGCHGDLAGRLIPDPGVDAVHRKSPS